MFEKRDVFLVLVERAIVINTFVFGVVVSMFLKRTLYSVPARASPKCSLDRRLIQLSHQHSDAQQHHTSTPRLKTNVMVSVIHTE